MKQLFTIPLSWLYSMVVSIRHSLFDWKILKSHEFDIPIVCVGNLAVGGTGKTPHTEYLVEMLGKKYNVAVLSRGYKRKTRGFYLATTSCSFKRIGDEPKQIKLKYPEIPVAVCEKRVEGIRLLREKHPEVNLIILDDAFQHRYVEPWVNVLLMDYNHPVFEDHMLPWGRLRDQKKQMNRAQIIIATKCPDDLRPLDYRIMQNNLELYSFQTLYFTRFHSEEPRPLFPSLNPKPIVAGQPIIAMAGIANPTNFITRLEQKYAVEHKLIFRDHYSYKVKDMTHLEELLKSMPDDTPIIVTEKDAVKLTNSRKIPENICRRLHYITVSVRFANDKESDFIQQLDQYVRTNQKNSITHPL